MILNKFELIQRNLHKLLIKGLIDEIKCQMKPNNKKLCLLWREKD